MTLTIITRKSWYNHNYHEIHKLWAKIRGYCNSHNIRLLDINSFQKEFMEILYQSSIED